MLTQLVCKQLGHLCASHYKSNYIFIAYSEITDRVT